MKGSLGVRGAGGGDVAAAPPEREVARGRVEGRGRRSRSEVAVKLFFLRFALSLVSLSRIQHSFSYLRPFLLSTCAFACFPLHKKASHHA